MTLGRRIAQKFQQYKWYYDPQQVQLKQREIREHITGMQQQQTPLAEQKQEEGQIVIQPKPSSETEAETETHMLPNLDMAWTYFEHVTLPRYVISSGRERSSGTQVIKSHATKSNNFGGKVNKYIVGSAEHQSLKRAEPGEAEKPTRLYPIWHTPLSQMGDFGIGVGLYFTTLLALSIITFVAGLISMPNLLYYSSTQYSVNGQPTHGPPGTQIIKIPTVGSAICTDQSWVLCQGCAFNQFRGAEFRIAVYNDTCDLSLQELQGNSAAANSNNCTMFAKKNNCLGAQMQQGMVNYAALMFVFVAMFVMNRYQRKKAVEFDEDEQTAQDYSIVVNNPPPDAYDPEGEILG